MCSLKLKVELKFYSLDVFVTKFDNYIIKYKSKAVMIIF
jgi:hypothetical protein